MALRKLPWYFYFWERFIWQPHLSDTHDFLKFYLTLQYINKLICSISQVVTPSRVKVLSSVR